MHDLATLRALNARSVYFGALDARNAYRPFDPFAGDRLNARAPYDPQGDLADAVTRRLAANGRLAHSGA